MSAEKQDSLQSSVETRLLEALAANGARVDAVRSGVRHDGVRGVFATRDLKPDEAAMWIPDHEVLNLDTLDPELRAAVKQTVAKRSFNDVEQTVYTKMISLIAGYLFEASRSTESRFYPYIEALPKEFPQTVNTFGPAERLALTKMNGNNIYEMYAPLVELTCEVIEAAKPIWGTPSLPATEEVQGAFYFVLSRMSYLRLIPGIDLANAAPPAEENARIAEEIQDGCCLITKCHVKAGEELVIDYNHHDAVSLLLSYGCTLGMERTRSVTRLQIADSLPAFLKAQLGGNIPFQRGAQLTEDQPAALDEKAFVLLKMAAMANVETLNEAIAAGYFKDPPTGPPDKLPLWHAKTFRIYSELETSKRSTRVRLAAPWPWCSTKRNGGS
eukprot:gnl/TRDRNA2_/TRDRNA2_164314_c0_seq2.p1 gnl/TRDRNA2_/TRDRNA2_164314_c0~~gnl/TRDRNA2_/TRDRNA2_164314_c0_seq2.p1  ORF type:complete len:385 (-),score=74.05 gnl/TRDRNA2_/TRDRNA2_164314_c0_seq2:181-1335(-)